MKEPSTLVRPGEKTERRGSSESERDTKQTGGIPRGVLRPCLCVCHRKETQITTFAKFTEVDPNFKITLAPALPW